MAKFIACGVSAALTNVLSCFGSASLFESSGKYSSLAFVNVNIKPKIQQHCSTHILCRNNLRQPKLRYIGPFSFSLHSQSLHSSDLDQTNSIGLNDDDFDVLPNPPATTWSVEDDWSALSADSAASHAFKPRNHQTAFNDEYDTATMNNADRILTEQDGILNESRSHANEWSSSLNADPNASPAAHCDAFIRDESNPEDQFVYDAVETILNHFDYDDVVPLYDTKSSAAAVSVNDEKDQDTEMAFMVRCGQTPEQFLVSQGRALPELTKEEKYSPGFLFQKRENGLDGSLQPKMTSFFKNAVLKIFQEYSDDDEKIQSLQVMDRKALARWMTNCLTYELSSSNRHDSAHLTKVGAYDKSINAFLSRYCFNHGSGRLTLHEFLGLYLESAWVGYINDVRKKKEVMLVDGRFHPVPSIDASVLIKDRKNTDVFLKDASLSIVWRDLEAHGTFSPAEEERVRLLREMEEQQRSATMLKSSRHDMMMDECELYDEYEDRLFDNNIIDEDEYHKVKKKEKSSHELVEMSSDGATPKRIRDGEFVFIDEESCIGCSQCATIAPGSFTMLEDTGRARTFLQRNTDEIEHAVFSCPVSCMHFVSYDELKEMETSRDEEGGFGGRVTHVPLHVAGRESDANRKSSWYHYLKAKCGSTQCPQRGCFDCPNYAPGENPYFKQRQRKAEHVRASEFKASGEAEQWRKVVDI